MQLTDTEVTITLTEAMKRSLRMTSIHNNQSVEEVIVKIIKDHYFGQKGD